MPAFHAACNELLDILGIPDAPTPERIEGNLTPLMDLAREYRINYYLAKWLLADFTDSIPQGYRSGLEKQLIINKTRNTLLGVQIVQLASLLRTAGIPVMFMKGAAGLMYGMYDIECRYISDIDMLIPDERIPGARTLIESEGYLPEKDTIVPDNHHHIVPYYHPKLIGGLEIHREPYGTSMLDRPVMPAIWDDAVTIEKDGAPLTVPSLNDHAWIVMRSEPVASVLIPRMKETVELADTIQYGDVDFGISRLRAESEDIPGLLAGYSFSAARLFDIPPFHTFDTARMNVWLRWSRSQQARLLRHDDRFRASVTRFGALAVLSPAGIPGKARLNSRLIRYDIEYEQVSGHLGKLALLLKNLLLHCVWFVDYIIISLRK